MCTDGVEFISGPQCGRCGLPLGDEREEGEDTLLCTHCAAGSRLAFSRARSRAVYGGVVRDLIRRMKFLGDMEATAAAVELFAASLPEGLSPSPSLVVPVPLHARRLRARGFNQSVLLGRRLARRLGCRFDPFLVRRIRSTVPQFELRDPDDKRRNVKGAFALSSPSPLDGELVLLVDDILTSGATADECARLLLDGGAAEVEVYTLARALGSSGAGDLEEGPPPI